MFCQVPCIRGQVEYRRIVCRRGNATQCGPCGILMLNLAMDKDKEKANVQKASWPFLEMKNSAYHYLYDLADLYSYVYSFRDKKI